MRAAVVALLVISVVSAGATLIVERSRRQEQDHRLRADREAAAAELAREEAMQSKTNAERAAKQEAAQRREG